MDETKSPGIILAQIFLLKAEFSHGGDPLALPSDTRVEVNLQVEVMAGHSTDGSQGFVRVNVVTVDTDASLYRFRVEMVGLVVRDDKESNLLPQEYVAKNGGALLFPFVREAVANITARGRFGPIWLKPMNLTLNEKSPEPPPG